MENPSRESLRQSMTRSLQRLAVAEGEIAIPATHQELAGAVRGLPLELAATDPAYEYEKAHLPAAAWPPTAWYANWATGLDVFNLPREQSPIELRWMVYRQSAARAEGEPGTGMV